jgi:hypothetical protein
LLVFESLSGTKNTAQKFGSKIVIISRVFVPDENAPPPSRGRGVKDFCSVFI